MNRTTCFSPVSPWSGRLGWLIAVVFGAIGLPAFVRMPPWCDLTLYELAARAMTTGGTHYRDIFDTNLPGFVWALIGVRSLFGPSLEAVRLVDLAVVAAGVLVLGRWVRRTAGGTASAWFAAVVLAFYPFTSEFCHAQRDVWMFLPVVSAVALRRQRLIQPERALSTFWAGFWEGLLWGVAVWFKPHVVVIAGIVWAGSVGRLGGRRIVLKDLIGNLLAGGLVGGAGVGWLLASGTWPHFYEVFTRWNPQYTAGVMNELDLRLRDHLFYFPPWSVLQPWALLLAAGDVLCWRCGLSGRLKRLPHWLYRPAESERDRLTRGVIALLFWASAVQGFWLQRRFHYVHVPETFLLFAVIAGHRWQVLAGGLLVSLLGSLAMATGWSPTGGWKLLVERHPITQPDRVSAWPSCFRGLDGRAADDRQDRHSLAGVSFPRVSVAEIGEVADWLTARGATAEEVIAWHDSPHAVFLRLPGRPRFRFMHLDTTLTTAVTYEWMRAELTAALPGTRFVVTDLIRLYATRPDEPFEGWQTTAADGLPTRFPAAARGVFPWNQPVVFRSGGGKGRYVVHELRTAVTKLEYDVDVWRTP